MDNVVAHRYAIFLCSWDVEIDDSLIEQLTNNVVVFKHHLKNLIFLTGYETVADVPES